jgi:cell division cycle protein 20 (cofactor of APC complex)
MQMDRFIPNRSAMDFDFAHYMLTEGRKAKKKPPARSLAAEAYRKRLVEVFNMDRTRILAFSNKSPTPVELIPREFSSLDIDKSMKPWRYVPKVGI